MYKFAKLKRAILGRMLNPDMWIEVNSSFFGEIVAESEEFVTIRKDGVYVHVKKEYIEENELG